MFHRSYLVFVSLLLSLTGCGDLSQLQGILQQTLPPGSEVNIYIQFMVHQMDLAGQNPALDVRLDNGQTRRLVLKSDRLKQAVRSGQIGAGSVFRLKGNQNLEIVGSDQLFSIEGNAGAFSALKQTLLGEFASFVIGSKTAWGFTSMSHDLRWSKNISEFLKDKLATA